MNVHDVNGFNTPSLNRPRVCRVHANIRPGRTGSSLQMNRSSLRNNRLKFKTAGNFLPIILDDVNGFNTSSLIRPRVRRVHANIWSGRTGS